MKKHIRAAGGDNLPYNFSWIIPGVLAGCAAPTGGSHIQALGKYLSTIETLK